MIRQLNHQHHLKDFAVENEVIINTQNLVSDQSTRTLNDKRHESFRILQQFHSPYKLNFSLNDTPLTFFMLATLLELPIQSNHHLLGKGTPCWNQQSSTTKTRQSGCLRKSWIHNIQNWAVTFSTRFTDLIVILILSGIIQRAISFRICLKSYMNIMHNTLISQVCNLLN